MYLAYMSNSYQVFFDTLAPWLKKMHCFIIKEPCQEEPEMSENEKMEAGNETDRTASGKHLWHALVCVILPGISQSVFQSGLLSINTE